MGAFPMIAPNEVNDPPPPSSNKKRDRISNLPAPIIHQVLSYLPAIDAARVGALSKTWRCFWESFPVLDLSQTRFQSALHPSLPDSEKRDLFITHLNNSIGRLPRSTTIDKFRLEACFSGHKSDSEIDKAIEIALKRNMHHLDLNFIYDHYNEKSEFKSSNFPQMLTSLKLKGLKLRPQEIFSLCPSIEDMVLENCELLAEINNSSTKLKNLKLENCIGVQSIELHACNLESFSYSYLCGDDEPIKISITGCDTSLKSLSLNYPQTTEQWFEDQLETAILNRSCNLPPSRYCSNSITSMKLNGFKFGLQELLSACPSTQELELHCCQLQSEEYIISSTRLKRLELRGCKGIEGFELHACNLRSFLYSGFGSNQHIGFTLIDCMLLENLCVKYAKVEEGWLEDHVSKFVNLESLVLDRVKGLKKRLIIRKEKFKSLTLIRCADVVEMEINSPILCSFQYAGEIPSLELLLPWPGLPGLLDLDARLTLDSNKEDPWWFVKLRKLLQNFYHCKDLNLVCQSYEDLIFPPEEKGEILPTGYVDLASPLKNVKILRIECPYCVSINYKELIESLLWLSPHLETLFVSSRDEKSCITFQYKTEEEDEDSFCCAKYPNECWQHYLKKVTMKNCEASLTCDDKSSLFKYLRDNAKILETIEDNSIQGN